MLISLLCMCLGLAPAFGAKVPRKAPELRIALPHGRQLRLSQYKGKVVALEFMLTTCPACLRTVKCMQKLYEEMGSRGFQPLVIALNNDAAAIVPKYVRALQLTFPMGTGNRDMAVDFLQHPVMLSLMVPQLVIIDKKGAIRAQYTGTDRFFRNEEENIRNTVEQLLKE